MNPSVSFTLSACHTQTRLSAQVQSRTRSAKSTNHADLHIDFLLDGQPNKAFASKIQAFLGTLLLSFPFLNQYRWTIETSNSFPHSAGIASSASSMSALALCLCDIERQLLGTPDTEERFLRKASLIARLGSGSACRSIYPKAAIWGTSSEWADGINDYAVPFADTLHPTFVNYHDAILIVSRSEKVVSSRAGHALMENNPFAPVRYAQARQHFAQLLPALQNGDLACFIKIVEAEALALHALMMTSEPSFILMHPNSLQIIGLIRQFRQDTNIPVCFTLDAGPNIHLLYPEQYADDVKMFIETSLVQWCENGEWIADQTGNIAKLA